MTILSRNDQGGRSMVEMLGVLAIIGVLSVGGISGYSKAMAKYKLTKVQDQITMLLMNIRTAYATSPSYTGLSAASVASYNLAPTEMVGADKASLYSAFGGAVDVAFTGASATYFYITLHNLGKEACRTLATSDWGADGLVSISVSEESSTTLHTHLTGNLPISLQSGASYCNNEVSKITWTYY